MNLYNVMVSYKGEGYINVYIPGLGDTTIHFGKPIYLKNASFNVIEALRQYRTMSIDIKINADQKGAFRIIDLNEQLTMAKMMKERKEQKQNNVTQEDIASILSSASNGPIVVEPKEPEQEPEIDYASYVLPSGSYEGKTLAEVDKEGKLKSVYSGFKSRNPEVKEAIEKYYASQVD